MKQKLIRIIFNELSNDNQKFIFYEKLMKLCITFNFSNQNMEIKNEFILSKIMFILSKITLHNHMNIKLTTSSYIYVQ